jgi:hypothetical protein
MNRPRLRSALPLLTALVAGGYGALLVSHAAAGVGGSDSAGYTNTARQIRAGRIVEPIAGLDALGLPDRFGGLLTPLAFEEGPRPRTMVPYYPPGFPLHIALASLLFGWGHGPFIVSPLAAVACLLLTFLIARELGLGVGWALAGAAILAACPVFLFQAVQVMGDVAATAWVAAAVLFALRGRRQDGWGLAAGAALGVAVMIRPANALIVPALALALGRRPRAIALAGLGGLPFAVFFLLWNRTAYGGAFHTGYSAQLGTELALANFEPRFPHYARWLVEQLSPLVPLGWLAVALERALPGRHRAMLMIWFLAYLAFYCFWGPYETWWYTRYLLPALPALIVGFLLAARALLRRFAAGGPRWKMAGPLAALIIVVGAAELRSTDRFSVLDVGRWQRIFPAACRAVAARAADGKALVVSMELSGALRFYTDLIPVRYDRIGGGDFEILRAKAAERGYRIFAALLPDELEPMRAQIPGDWVAVDRLSAAVVWELRGR